MLSVLVRFAVRVLCLGLVLLFASTAFAAPKGKNHDRAVRLVVQSQGHYEAGRFREAIQLLEEAYGLEQSPTILSNLARAYEGVGDVEHALDAYQKYIATEPKASDRGAVEKRIETLKQQIAERERLERERDDEARRAAAAREATEREKAKQKNAPRPSERRQPSVIPWIVTGVGVAVIGGGVFLGLRSRARHDEAVDERQAKDSEDLNDSAKSLATGANVCFVAGGILTAAGITWAVIDGASTGKEERASVAIRGRF
jgi:tetratricopeptide (TPR) repeat protein